MSKKILFVHQNFPGQFAHLARALLMEKRYQVDFISMRDLKDSEGFGKHIYQVSRGSTKDIHPWVVDFETKIIRAEAVFKKAFAMKSSGYCPDLIIAHPGWGESIFLKDIWPEAKLAIYCEFYYHAEGADVGFDPEFDDGKDVTGQCKIRIKNLNNLIHFDVADYAISPTHWQASTFPEKFRSKILVVHDGVDTNKIKPDSNVKLNISSSHNDLSLTKSDEIITFVNRNMEPYRGYHIFMRALPEILKRKPNVKVLLIGGDGLSYGVGSKDGRKWKDIFLDEIKPQLNQSQLSRIIFLGSVPYQHYLKILQISTVHVYLTYPFVLSWSLVEAMAAGCSIVASDTAPVREAIQHNKNGILVNFFNHKQLADDVCMLIEDISLRKKIGHAARVDAKEKYDLFSRCLPAQIKWVDEILGS